MRKHMAPFIDGYFDLPTGLMPVFKDHDAAYKDEGRFRRWDKYMYRFEDKAEEAGRAARSLFGDITSYVVHHAAGYQRQDDNRLKRLLGKAELRIDLAIEQLQAMKAALNSVEPLYAHAVVHNLAVKAMEKRVAKEEREAVKNAKHMDGTPMYAKDARKKVGKTGGKLRKKSGKKMKAGGGR